MHAMWYNLYIVRARRHQTFIHKRHLAKKSNLLFKYFIPERDQIILIYFTNIFENLHSKVDPDVISKGLLFTLSMYF